MNFTIVKTGKQMYSVARVEKICFFKVDYKVFLFMFFNNLKIHIRDKNVYDNIEQLHCRFLLEPLKSKIVVQ